MVNKRGILLLFLIFTGVTVFADDFDVFPNNGYQGSPGTVYNNETDTFPESRPAVPGEVPQTFVPGPSVPPSPAAPDSEPSFRLSETENSLLFLQRLNWEGGRYAVRYTVILERKREGMEIYTEVRRRNVEAPDTHLDISVPAGDYRFRVLSFNILGRLDSESDWEYFSIIQALQPTILAFEPASFYFDRLAPRIITVIGENLLLEADIYLLSLTMFDESGEPLILRPREIFRNELGENARLVFYEEDLIAGKYDIIVKNPGGLEARLGVFSIAVAKPFDINVSGGYTPMFTLFGKKDYFLDRVFVPLSFSARISFVPLKLDIGNFGAEFSAGWSYLTSDMNGFKTHANLVLINAGALFQYWIIKKELSFNSRAGVGFAGLFDYRFVFNTGKTWEPINMGAFSFNLGASLQWQFFKQFFAEAGLDYIQVIHREIPMGFLRIGLFGGYQF